MCIVHAPHSVSTFSRLVLWQHPQTVPNQMIMIFINMITVFLYTNLNNISLGEFLLVYFAAINKYPIGGAQISNGEDTIHVAHYFGMRTRYDFLSINCFNG